MAHTKSELRACMASGLRSGGSFRLVKRGKREGRPGQHGGGNHATRRKCMHARDVLAKHLCGHVQHDVRSAQSGHAVGREELVHKVAGLKILKLIVNSCVLVSCAHGCCRYCSESLAVSCTAAASLPIQSRVRMKWSASAAPLRVALATASARCTLTWHAGAESRLSRALCIGRTCAHLVSLRCHANASCESSLLIPHTPTHSHTPIDLWERGRTAC